MSPKKKKIASAHLQQIISPGANMSGTVLYIPFDRVAQRMRFPTVFRSILNSLAIVRGEKRTTRLFQLLGMNCLLAMVDFLPFLPASDSQSMPP
jgi:hypothetical protein